MILQNKVRFEKKLILIYGFGKSGKACFKYLKKKNNIKIYDDKLQNISKKNKKYILNKRELNFLKFDFIVISPGIDSKKCSLKNFLLKNKNKVINELDIFHLENPKNIKISVTGTNGKSTTSKIIFDILKYHKKDVRLVGNIGNPILNETKIKPRTVFVIEVSSYQIEYSKYFKSQYSLILNISPDHLERHGNLKNYVKAKCKLLKRQSNKDFALIEKNNILINREIRNNKFKSKIIPIDLKKDIKIENVKNKYFENLNNINNLKFIFQLSKLFKLNNKIILKVINKFSGLNYRQQITHQNKNLIIINDSKSTSFSSSINLLKSYNNIYWIAGGQSKKGDKFVLDKKYYKNIKAYLFGKNKNFFAYKLKKKIKFKKFKNILNCLINIKKDIKKDNLIPSVILFSPSAASFDQFTNFEERGEYFNKCIRKLKLINK